MLVQPHHQLFFWLGPSISTCDQQFRTGPPVPRCFDAFRKLHYIYRVNCNNLTATSLESWLGFAVTIPIVGLISG